MPVINAMTGGYPATLVVSGAAIEQIRGLKDQETVSLDDEKYVRASRSGRLVVIAEANGRTYDVDYYDI